MARGRSKTGHQLLREGCVSTVTLSLSLSFATLRLYLGKTLSGLPDEPESTVEGRGRDGAADQAGLGSGAARRWLATAPIGPLAEVGRATFSTVPTRLLPRLLAGARRVPGHARESVEIAGAAYH